MVAPCLKALQATASRIPNTVSYYFTPFGYVRNSNIITAHQSAALSRALSSMGLKGGRDGRVSRQGLSFSVDRSASGNHLGGNRTSSRRRAATLGKQILQSQPRRRRIDRRHRLVGPDLRDLFRCETRLA